MPRRGWTTPTAASRPRPNTIRSTTCSPTCGCISTSATAPFVPFVEVDGQVEGNDFRTLIRENPYIVTGFVLPKNTVDYNLRFGVSGNAGNRFAYRIFIGMSWIENARYWYGLNFPQAETAADNYLQFGIAQARRNTAVIGGELNWRPARDFRIDWEVRGFMHDFTARIGEHKLGGGLPALETTLSMQYDHRRFSIGARPVWSAPATGRGSP